MIKTVIKVAFVLVCLAASLNLFGQTDGSADPRALEQFIKGNTAAQQGNPYQAIYFYEEALRYDPGAPYLHVALAEEYLVLAQENNSSEAITRAEEHLAQALKLDPEHKEALELRARLLSAQGKTKQAAQIVEGLLKDDPTNTGYRVELLTLSLTLGEYLKVDSLYAILNSGEEPDLDLTRRVVAIYLMTGASDRAIPYMEELYRADTTDAAVTYTLATLYLQNGDTAVATRTVEQAIGLDSTDSRFWYLRLVIEFEGERYDSVLVMANKARAAAGEDAKSANLEGLSYMRLADSTAARDRFQRAIELDSTLFPAAGSLALLYDAVDSLQMSERHYEKAIALSDSAAIYMNNCAYMYAVRGLQLDKAMTLVDAALAKEPNNSSYLDTKGWIYFQQREFKDALKWIKKALKHDADSAALLEHIGDVYFAMGKDNQAREHWLRALESDPNSPSLKEKLGH